jgi:hypothetical protein
MFRPILLPCVLLLMASLQPTVRAADDTERKAAELKWAKGVASDFFDAAFKGNVEQAESLLDPTLKKTFAKEGENRVREWLNNSIGIQGFRSPSFSSEEMAPDADEAAFKGTFRSDSSFYHFNLRVAKDKESGKWRVCYFQFNTRDKKPK